MSEQVKQSIIDEKVLDLRNTKNEVGIELKIGSSLFAVADARDPGTCGPYFTDKSRAVLWAFYTSLCNYQLRPRIATEVQPKFHHRFERGQVATNWLFPKESKIIVEIVLNRTVRFSDLMIDSNPFAYVTYRFGAHDPVSKTVHLNADNDNVSLLVKEFADDKSWLSKTQPKISYCGILTMFPHFITKNAHSWIKCSQPNMIDANLSLKTLLNEHLLDFDVAKEKYHENIVDVGIRIHAPEELTAQRYYHSLNWEKLWLFFMAWLYQKLTVAQINQAMPAVVNQVVGGRTSLPPVTSVIILDANLVCIIISHCETLKDAIAFLSINQHFRFNLYHRALIQSNLRLRFLPSIDDFFIRLHHQNVIERQNLLGLPKKSEKSDRWWKLGGVLFKEDFRAEEQQEVGPDTEEIPRWRRSVYLEPKLTLPLIRATNSFMTMFGMLYSLNHYSTLPRLVSMVINHHDKHGTAAIQLQATARMPEYMPNAGKTALEMLAATTTIDYPHTISCIDCRGSWLHDVAMPYFFLDSAFAKKLENAKAFEKQRYDITMYYSKLIKSAGKSGVRPEMTPSHKQAVNTPLVNTLQLFRGETMIGYINCYMSSGLFDVNRSVTMIPRESPDYIDIFLNQDALGDDWRLNPDFETAYTKAGDTGFKFSIIDIDNEFDKDYDHPCLPDSPTPYEILDASQIVHVQISLSRSLNMDQVYYQAYMFMTVLIRKLIHEDRVDRAIWSVNF